VLGGLDHEGAELRAARDELVSSGAKGAFCRPAWRAEESRVRRSPASVEFYFSRRFQKEGKCNTPCYRVPNHLR
jgi:hypothetical protein